MKLSIIVPVFNGEHHIPRLVESLDSQTSQDFEVIFVVDAKSTDGSLNVVKSLCDSRSSYTYYIQTDATKLGGARNIGFEHASGEFVWFLDVDDRPLSEFISKLLEIQTKYDADVVGCNFIYSYDRDAKFEFKNEYSVVVMNRLEALISRTKEKFPITAWSKIIRSRIIRDNDLKYRSGYAEDVDFTYKLLSCSDIICYTEEPLYVYVQDPNSICNSSITADLRGVAELQVYKDLYEFFENDKDFSERFLIASTRMRIRCCGHMSYKSFMKTVKSTEFKKMLNAVSNPPMMEGIAIRLLPRTYFAFIKSFLKLYYYRNGRLYTDNSGIVSKLKLF